MTDTGDDEFARFGIEERPVGDGITVLALSGDADLSAASQLSPVLGAAIATTPLVVVDLADVVMLGSAAIAVLLGNHRRAARGHELRVVAAKARTYDPLDLLGLTDLLHVYRSLHDALADALPGDP